MFKKIAKRIMYITLIILALFVLSYILFTNFYPSFGGDVSKEQQVLYEKSEQFDNGKFNNVNPVPKELTFAENMKLAYAFFTAKVENGTPEKDLKTSKIDSTDVANYNGAARLVWFGHSAFLLQLDGKTILLDPMLGKVAAPHPLLGGNRFNKEAPLSIEKLPKIDAVIFSHDHYDHLDYETVLKIKDKTNHFYVPLGIRVHLEAWGVASDRITELDWWENAQLDGIQLVCTPAQHFSGRKLSNGQSTLWESLVIQSQNEKI
jgi:hypothetical protein